VFPEKKGNPKGPAGRFEEKSLDAARKTTHPHPSRQKRARGPRLAFFAFPGTPGFHKTKSSRNKGWGLTNAGTWIKLFHHAINRNKTKNPRIKTQIKKNNRKSKIMVRYQWAMQTLRILG